jgi:DNA-binding IclR family transcriptional regulator
VAMEAHGLVRRDSDGRFCLGYRLVGLGRAAASGGALRDRALPALTTLRERTGESVQLYVRDGAERVCLVSLESTNELRTIVEEGARLPLEKGSAGAVLSGAWHGTEQWAQSVGERQAGVASVSSPVCDADGQVVAAVSVSGPIERLGRAPGERLGKHVSSAARSIERALRQ